MNPNPPASVPTRKKLSYAAPAFALAIVGIPIYVYIPKFYTDSVGVNIAVLGYLLSGVRVFDALTDPVIGILSDKTRTPFGRRRPYIALGSVCMTGVMYLLFNPPDASPLFETFWFGLWIYVLFLFWTLVVVPYESLGPEITFDYDERTSLFAMRDGFLIAGTLAAASSPAVIRAIFGLTADAAGEREKFFWLAVIYAPLIIGSCWWCVNELSENPYAPSTGRRPFFSGLRRVVRNRPFMILLIAYTIGAVGSNLPATLILYYVEYVLGSPRADLFLVIYFVTGIGFLPMWIRLSGTWGKKRSWLGSMVVNTGAFIGVFFLGAGDEWLYGILVFLSGIGFGATLALPSAIQADVIDYDELYTGERREGEYIGLWSISRKFAAAIGIGVGLTVLGLSGYRPNVAQSEQVKFTLRVLYALVPSLCNIGAFAVALAYPISSSIHKEIRSAIDLKKAGHAVRDPLKPLNEIMPDING